MTLLLQPGSLGDSNALALYHFITSVSLLRNTQEHVAM